jgi:hypothetical protein
MSLECSLASDLTCRDKCIDLVCALIRVQCFHVHHLLHHVILQENAVAADDFPRNLAYLAAHSRAEGLSHSYLAH